MIVTPVYECDPNVLVTGVLDGASMEVSTDQGQGGQFLFYGNSVRFSVGSLKLGEAVTAKQYLRECDIESKPSATVKAAALTKLDPARISPVVCPGAKQVEVTGLVAGALVTIGAGRYGGEKALLGSATAKATKQTFDVPEMPSWPSGPAQYVLAEQSRCNARQTVLEGTQIEGLPSVPGAPTLPTMVECGRLVAVTGLVAGVTVRLTSDQADWAVLSAPLQATDTQMTVMLYRPLRKGEKVTATVTGCGAGAGAATTGTVLALTNLLAPKVQEPVRSWMSHVKVVDCVPGAQVHVYVNGVWRARGEATGTAVEVFAGDLKAEDRVTALQCLCTKISPTSAVATVTLGRMRVKPQPAPAVRGPASQSVTVHVEDLDDRHKVPAKITMPGGSTFPANAPFDWIFPLGMANPTIQVTAVDYAMETVTWPLVDPPPVPTTAPLSLQLQAYATGIVVKEVSWTVSKQEVPPNLPSFVASASGSSASVNLPKPASGQTLYYIGCSVDFTYFGASRTVNFVNHTISNYPGTAMIGWSGTPLTGKFELTGVWTYNAEGAVEFVFWVHFAGV
jgi:hypothetical protein